MTAVALILTATQAESKEVSCQTVERLTDQGSFDLTAILSVAKGRIENVALEQTIAPRNPSKVGYTCRANVADGVPNSHWETRGDKTIVSIAPDETGEPSSLAIIKVKRGYVLKTKNRSKAECAARVEWPEQVFIPAPGGAYRICALPALWHRSVPRPGHHQTGP